MSYRPDNLPEQKPPRSKTEQFIRWSVKWLAVVATIYFGYLTLVSFLIHDIYGMIFFMLSLICAQVAADLQESVDE